MSVEYLEVKGIKDATQDFHSKVEEFDGYVKEMNDATQEVLVNWLGKGRNQFETQMQLMILQLNDISDGLYDIYNALVDAEAGYIDEDEAVAKQFDAMRT